jgi:hypothetical protein
VAAPLAWIKTKTENPFEDENENGDENERSQ